MNSQQTNYLHLFRPLDYVVLVLALCAALFSFTVWHQQGKAERVQIYREGTLYQEIDLSLQKKIHVEGPLGDTIIEIDHGKARIAADPSPRQYCVRDGWLQKAGQVAICLPNHTSIVIVGQNQEPAYDSLTY